MTTFLSYFLIANIFVFFSWGTSHFLLRRKRSMTYRQVLLVTYLLLLLSLFLPLISFEGAIENPFGPVVRVVPSEIHFSNLPTKMAPAVEVGGAQFNLTAAMPEIDGVLILLISGFAFFAAVRLVLSLRKIASLEIDSFCIKKIGRAEVWVSPAIKTPFSVHYGVAQVFLPLSILSRPESMRIALRHEIQHHRYRDTLWVHLVELFRAAFFLNPFAHKLARLIEELQELACDEALIVGARVNPSRYGQCLLEFVEEDHSNNKYAVSCGMASEYSFLKERINAMFSTRKKTSLRSLAMLGLASIIGFSGSAWALKGAVKDQYFSLQEIEQIAAQTKSDIPIAVDKNVVYWLNHAINHPKKRMFYKKALQRANYYRAMMGSKFAAEGVTLDLLAIPVMESGYQNLEKPTSMGSVGIWQFIPSTARRYGLTVNSELDERMVPERHTDAAVAYYKALYTLFEDYHAALLSYGIGEKRVAELILLAGHKDMLKIVREADLSKAQRNYLPKAIATLILYKNPHLLD